MNKISAFFRLIRWQNLVFIVLTQLLFYFCIYETLYDRDESHHQIIWLVIASVLIAAAGYIINDYFDLNIDRVNKPDKNVLNSIIKRRWAIIWHLVLSVAGIIATAIAVGFEKWYLIAANIICVVLLWFYSTSLKRQLLIGNIVISVLTAWTVLIVFYAKTPFEAAFGADDPATIKFFRFTFLYAGFAFIISLIREAVKDVEDMEGDMRYGCKTLPIVAGVTATKIYTAVWLVVIIAAVVLLQLYIMQFGWWFAIAYCFLLIIIPLCLLLYKLKAAHSTADFAALSRFCKLIMFTGILSMIFFPIYS